MKWDSIHFAASAKAVQGFSGLGIQYSFAASRVPLMATEPPEIGRHFQPESSDLIGQAFAFPV